jgi:hypothetical protein
MSPRVSVKMVNGKLFLVMGLRMGWSDDPADEPG